MQAVKVGWLASYGLEICVLQQSKPWAVVVVRIWGCWRKAGLVLMTHARNELQTLMCRTTVTPLLDPNLGQLCKDI